MRFAQDDQRSEGEACVPVSIINHRELLITESETKSSTRYAWVGMNTKHGTARSTAPHVAKRHDATRRHATPRDATRRHANKRTQPSATVAPVACDVTCRLGFGHAGTAVLGKEASALVSEPLV